MEHVLIEIRHSDGPFEFADQEYETDRFPSNCIIELVSRGVTAKSRLAATHEEAIKAFRHFLQEDISAPVLWTFIDSLQHRTTKEEV